MIDVVCRCTAPRQVPENAVGRVFSCEKCRMVNRIVCGEQLSAGSGGGDFDGALTIVAGPDRVGERIQLGGIAEITLGKSGERQLVLIGDMVSRFHARLVRVDFGPSRWKLFDNRSTNGLYVNEQRVAEHELRNGDLVRIGDYTLKFEHVQQVAEPVIDPNAVICPSCRKQFNKTAKICVGCGINLRTGKPILTRQGVDENHLYAAAESWIRIISLFVWVTPFPIPLRSEGFGKSKPYAIWTIAMATILASITFFIAQRMTDEGSADVNLMLWAPAKTHLVVMNDVVSPEAIHHMAQQMDDQDRAELREKYDRLKRLNDEELLTKMLSTEISNHNAAQGEFHWYQLITHAFLHDTSSIYNFAMHLGGNLVFMLCFGTRVNALIGNIATAILYPILAIAAGGIYLMTLSGPSFGPLDGGGHGPMLGASGAIMGLAGMYLILFPVHQVYCAMWISIWLRFKRFFRAKIFTLRGFWILLIYFGYDITMSIINAKLNVHGGVAHWAHIGGFTTGMVLGLAILLSRLFDTHGGDVLSVVLGPKAWPIIGRPERWNRSEPLPA
jgi:membrane associated rhomboid family serine protease/pSer/pThr/pTyr-binding forkhead associated (FHA) protein